MVKETDTQVTFWIDKDKLVSIDDFIDSLGRKSRSQFIIECMTIVKTFPFLLDPEKTKNIELDHSILLELIKLFKIIPCEFELNSSEIIENRVEDLKKEIDSK